MKNKKLFISNPYEYIHFLWKIDLSNSKTMFILLKDSYFSNACVCQCSNMY